MDLWGDEDGRRRTLGIRDRQILLERAGKKCEVPSCGEPLDYSSMQIGHKTAFSRGGSTSLKNSVVLCYKHNKLQGTDSWPAFLRKLGTAAHGPPAKSATVTAAPGSVNGTPGETYELKNLSIDELKALAKKLGVKVKGRVEEGMFEDTRLPPTKAAYVKALAKAGAGRDTAGSQSASRPRPRPRRKRNSFSFW